MTLKDTNLIYHFDNGVDKGSYINDVSFEGEGGGVKNEILRKFLGLKLGRQGEEGGSRNPKIEDSLLWEFPNVNARLEKHLILKAKICPF